MDDISVVMMTAPDPEKAAVIARCLVEEQLAACVNLVPQVRSIYRWQGEVCDEPEVLLIAKTPSTRVEALRCRVLELHPYTTPEVLELGVVGGHAPYLDWVRASVR